MPRWRNPLSAQDDEPTLDGDSVWLGVNAKLSPDKLEPGYASSAINKLFADGSAATRPGMTTTVYHDTGLTGCLGSGIYSDPNGVEYLVQVFPGSVRLTRHGSSPRTVAVPVTLSGSVSVVQAFNRLLLFRGTDNIPLEWDGADSDGFSMVSQTEAGDGTSPIPNAATAELMNNRLFIPVGDIISASELFDYTRYDAALSSFNVNNGSDDELVRIFPFTNNTLLVFKDQSVHAISNVYGDLSEIRLDQLNPELGCAAARSVAMVGADVFWLSSTGVFRLTQVIQDRLQTSPVAVSDPIDPLIARINPFAIGTAVAAVWGKYYVLAVPFDDATRPDTLLIYDTVAGAWQGVHTTAAPVYFDNLLVTDYQGRKRLHAIDHTAGRVVLLFEGALDVIDNTRYEIADELVTRGYNLRNPALKRIRRVEWNAATWWPSYSVSLALEGQNESSAAATAITKSRTAYYTHGTGEWDPSNVNDDHANPYRQDYSIDLDTAIDPGSNGLDFDLLQTVLERRQVNARARWVALRFRGTQGRCNILSASVEADAVTRAPGTFAA